MLDWKRVDPLMLCQGEKVLQRLEQSGYSAYFVGGCVRDELMGRPVHDMDIATSAKPEQVMELFERTVPTGLAHGTVTVIMEGIPFEVTTYRTESDYKDHRHPSSVQFVDHIVDDLQRRDFTMNAIARSVDGLVIDPFHGQEDIGNRVIRCVGNAEERFEEDALRMMRAIRFASVFGFRPVKSLWRALLQGRDKLSFIAMERVRTELEKTLLGPDPLRGLELLYRSRLMEYAKLPISVSRPKEEMQVALIESIPYLPDKLRWSALLQGIGISGDEVKPLMKRWTFPNEISRYTAQIIGLDEAWTETLVLNHVRTDLMTTEELSSEQVIRLRPEWIKLELQYGPEIALGWLTRQRVLLDLLGERVGQAWHLLAKQVWRWHEGMSAHQIKDLAVTGQDVVSAIGRQGGPWLGDLMKLLLEQVALGELENEPHVLLQYAKKVVNTNHE